MAAVLDALAPYVMKLIKDMAEEEVSMLLGVSGEIKRLGDNVGSLEAYVADAERRRIDDAMVQRWVSKLKDALYEATEILELCQLDDEEARGGCWEMVEKKSPSFLLPLLFCLRNPIFAHDMGGRIKDLNSRLDGIRKEMAGFGFGFAKLDAYQLRTPPSAAAAAGAAVHSHMTTSFLDESALVGDAIEAEAKAAVQELVTSETAIKVVSITGAGGMGKTTLAKKIFSDKNIEADFRSRVWLSVTERYDPRRLLSSAITQASGEKDPHGDLQILTQILVTALSAGRFLLVMDDVWSSTPWTQVLQSPVLVAAHTQPRSRVIITTRNEDLVKDMGLAYCAHRVKPLCHEDAWSLLKKQLQLQDVGGSEGALDQLKDIGIEIIKKCDGLPLAIKAIGGLLRTKRATKHEWEGVLHDAAWNTETTHSDLNSALRLSYEDLSPSMKQCFLYFSLIPRGHRMVRDDVIGMWMGEGFLEVSPQERWKEPEDIGICYYRDLIARNLIEKYSEYVDGAGCVMHDVVRSFARYMAKEEASVIAPGEISSLDSSPKFRRLCVEPTATEIKASAAALPDWSIISEKQERLRSLFACGRMKYEPDNSTAGDWCMSNDSNRFPSLRVLFVRFADSERFVGSLGNLRHLRFLILWETDISRLPEAIGKMRLLEHIQLQRCRNFGGQAPSGMLKLERLRFLSLIDGTKFTVPKGLGVLTNLRTLKEFPAQIDDDEEWCSLQEVGPLSLLRTVVLRNLRAVPSASLAAKAKIREKVQLRFLCMSAETPNEKDIAELTEGECQQVEEVFNELCPPPQLQELHIHGYVGHRLPRWAWASSSMDFHSLTYLLLESLPLCNQLPDGLCRLPCLETLIINFAPAIYRVGAEFQQPQIGSGSGSSSRLARTSFPSLHDLILQRLPNWEEWEWEEEEEEHSSSIAMPCLHKLCIAESKLDSLPAGLASSRRLALKELYLCDVARITAVENFPSVVKLQVRSCPCLSIIRGFPSVHRVEIMTCPALEVLEAGPALDTVELSDPDMQTLPEYLNGLTPRIMRLKQCHQKLRDLLLLLPLPSSGHEYRAEMDKIKHCGKLVVL
ncbi:hypothetical protein BS78_K276600 [Paspalum vaginatum]|uniref:Uncharacterized protein n=1 Tax=Paspalum vaginatum TaxID=158149 RepID=A0A9W8CEX8_9POAL|nr:hypothetical protein BS78_K276600 [Paspalum vaginatum]